MKRRTTTHQLQQAIKGKLLKLIKAEKYNKSTCQTDVISIDLFKDDLDFLCETIFADAVGWYFEYDIKAKQYVIECSRMNGDSDFIFIAHLCACDDSNVENIERILKIEEE